MITTGTQADVKPARGSFNAAYVWMISIIAALGGLLFGYDWVVIGGAKPFFEKYFHLTNAAQSGWANSCALIGCLMGALVAGAMSDRFGRKRLLIFSALLFAVTSVGNALAPTFDIFVAWRISGGVAIGLASNLSPMYIAEIAPAHLRGRLVSINQLTIVIGILLAQVINWFLVRNLPAGATEGYIVDSWYGQTGWRWMFALTAVPSLLFFAGMFLAPESPRWLVKKERSDLALGILERVGGKAYAESEVIGIKATMGQNEIDRVNFGDLLDRRWSMGLLLGAVPRLLLGVVRRYFYQLKTYGLRRMFKVLLLGVVLAVFQQWCGINVIFNYAEEIFRQAGYDISDVLKNIAWTGSVNFVFTLVALAIVDWGGRRVLMLFGAAGLAVIYTVLGFCYHHNVQGWPMLALVLAAIGCYAMSLAPVTWVVVSEIFPNRIRGAAMAVAVTSLWIACFLLTYTFPMLNKALGADGTFWLYAAICLAGLVFIFFKLPETKGKSLEQLEKELVD